MQCGTPVGPLCGSAQGSGLAENGVHHLQQQRREGGSQVLSPQRHGKVLQHTGSRSTMCNHPDNCPKKVALPWIDNCMQGPETHGTDVRQLQDIPGRPSMQAALQRLPMLATLASGDTAIFVRQNTCEDREMASASNHHCTPLLTLSSNNVASSGSAPGACCSRLQPQPAGRLPGWRPQAWCA